MFELRGDIASGDHVPPNVRVLSMRDNPVQNWADLRQEVMDRLKSENEALLRRLEELEASGSVSQSSGEHLVPKESWEKEHKERCDLEEMVKQKEKRLLRLQQASKISCVPFLILIINCLPWSGFQQQGARISGNHVFNTRLQVPFLLEWTSQSDLAIRSQHIFRVPANWEEGG